MKKKIDTCPIVIVGAWNKAIFTPEWIQKYIIMHDAFEVRIPQPHLVNASLQFVTPDFAINILGERLEFRITGNPEKAVECLRNILRILPHTPIVSMGINTAYIEDSAKIPQELTNKLNLNEDLKNLEVISSAMIIALKVNEQSFLNIRIIKEGNDITFDFNYDFRIKEAQNIFDIIGEDDTIINKKEEEAKELLEQLYNLKIE
ncbi:hypothetical protein [Gabonibacter massiliensis]|uniref:hypothetical protein n=1 Tax=Gabonibacter massiliensis TaxID=1720195 RepID=UPI00073E6F55|nr:hypothetical protein [Gabonibacter massiliensis]